MMLKPIIFALVFAFLARAAGGDNDNKTFLPGFFCFDNNVKKCEMCQKCCQDCSSIFRTTKYMAQKASYSTDGGIAMTTDGTEQESSGTQSTKLTTTTNYTTQKPSTVQLDTPGTTRSNNGHTYNCNNSPQHYNLRYLALSFALTIVSLLLVGLFVYHWCTVIRRPRWNQDNEAVIAISDVASNSFAMRLPSTNISQEQLNEESKPLKSLLEHPNTLKRICVVLDTRMPGCGDYEAVAQHYGFDHYERKSDLEKADDGPSRALIEGLAARHPNLTVEEFVVVVEEKTKRGDVSWLLRKYDSM